MVATIKRSKLKTKKSLPVKLLHTETVNIDRLVLYPKNPRRSELQDIADSLKENGQFQAVVVRLSTMHVLVGNHRVKAAKRVLGWDSIYVQYVECDDDRAARVVLADNRLGEKGGYDELARAELIASLDNPSLGTGYTVVEVDEITAQLNKRANELSDALDKTVEDYTPVATTNDRDVDSDDLDTSSEDTSFDKAGDRLEGTMQLSDEMDLPPSDLWGRWEVPILRRDMIMTPAEWPRDISVWAGGATRDTMANEDPDHWWLYIFGISSTSGIKYRNRVVLCYYTYDHYFEPWWVEPAKYTTRAINSGIKYVISPNFSTWASDPMFESLYSLYKARWLARYLQEAGLRIVPDVEWPSSDLDKHQAFLDEYVLPSMPKNLPMISIQGNTATGNVDKETMARDKIRLARQYRQVVDTLKPEALFYYGRPNWIEFVKSLDLQTEILSVTNHREEINKQYRDRNKQVL